MTTERRSTSPAHTTPAGTDATPAEASAEVPTPMPWRRFVAVGDSFSEGLWDPDPQNADRCRGWADRLAESLAARTEDEFRYANLAVRGRLLRPIIVDQLPRALELEPDLVSIIGGGNDLLRPGADPDVLARNLEDAVARIRAAGADVLLGTGMDTVDTPLLRATRSRVAVLNAHVWSIAQRHGAHVLDLWGARYLRDWRMWTEDRIHLTPEAHRRTAQAALVALGQRPDDPDWASPLDPEGPIDRLARARGDARWMREHVYPWVRRRVGGRSSGDAREPKRSELLPLTPPR